MLIKFIILLTHGKCNIKYNKFSNTNFFIIKINSPCGLEIQISKSHLGGHAFLFFVIKIIKIIISIKIKKF